MEWKGRALKTIGDLMTHGIDKCATPEEAQEFMRIYRAETGACKREHRLLERLLLVRDLLATNAGGRLLEGRHRLDRQGLAGNTQRCEVTMSEGECGFESGICRTHKQHAENDAEFLENLRLREPSLCTVAADALRARLDDAEGTRASLYDVINSEARELGITSQLSLKDDARPAVRALVDALRAKVLEAEDERDAVAVEILRVQEDLLTQEQAKVAEALARKVADGICERMESGSFTKSWREKTDNQIADALRAVRVEALEEAAKKVYVLIQQAQLLNDPIRYTIYGDRTLMAQDIAKRIRALAAGEKL